MQTPVMVMNTNSKRETGRKAQLANIQAAKVKRIITMPLGIFPFWISSNILGSRINRHFDPGTSGYVKNAVRPNGRYRYDKWRVRKYFIYSNAILR